MIEAVDLACERGERLLFRDWRSRPARPLLHVAGENGAGKTSLLRSARRATEPTPGEVRSKGGTDIRRLREEFWKRARLRRPRQRREGRAHGRREPALRSCDRRPPCGGKRGARARSTRLGLHGYADRPVRASVARPTAPRRVGAATRRRGGALWILDEPFTALDVRGIEVLRELVTRAARRAAAASC